MTILQKEKGCLILLPKINIHILFIIENGHFYSWEDSIMTSSFFLFDFVLFIVISDVFIIKIS
jgi:hypothetical protein